MNNKILVADDEIEIVELIELYLQKENYEVLKAHDGFEAYNIINTQRVDLAVIDIMMPGLDGYKLVKMIREKNNVPVIFLSAKNDDNDKILGLGLGADDYMTKPFNPLELLARIEAQLRRFYKLNDSTAKTDKQSAIKIGDIMLDQKSCAVYKKGVQLMLTSTEYKILLLLMKNPGRVYTKRQIFETVWQELYYGDDNVIMVHMSNIRDKIEGNSKKAVYIKTVRGLGYKFEKDVKAGLEA